MDPLLVVECYYRYLQHRQSMPEEVQYVDYVVLVCERVLRPARPWKEKPPGTSDHHRFTIPDVPQGNQAIVNGRC